MKERFIDKTAVKDALLFASGASFPFFVVAPLTIYFANSEEFDFTFYNFWFYPLICFAMAVVVLAALYLAAGRISDRSRNAFAGLLFAFGIACWLQSRFLAEDLGAFNGQPYNWQASYGHIVSDGLIWLLLLVVCAAAAAVIGEKCIRVMKAVSVAFSVFLLVTLLITVFSARKEYFRPESKYVTDHGMFTASQECNVIVLIPDMFDEEYFSAIAEESPELLEEFEGFTYFGAATGTYGGTNYALGSFLAGQPLLNSEDTYSLMLNSAYRGNTMFSKLKSAGWNLGIYTDGKFIPDELAAETENCVCSSPRIIAPLRFIKTLYRLCACSWLPDGLRCIFWMNGTEFDDMTAVKGCPCGRYSSSNLEFYEHISQGLSLAAEPCFRFIHLYGAHYPYLTDEYLQSITPSYSDESAIKAAKGVVKIISAYLEELKAINAYDNSLIIVMADHGYSIDGGLTNPLLLIKRPGDTGLVRQSDAPVSQWDVRPEILFETGLTGDEGEKAESIFSITPENAHERLYYQLYDTDVNGLSRLVEYSVLPEGNERKYFHLTDREFTSRGELVSHSAHCRWCEVHGTDPVDAPNNMSIMH